MGNCCKVSQPSTNYERLYRRNTTLTIKSGGFSEKVIFSLPNPEKLSLSCYSFGKLEFSATACMLQGVDPRGKVVKKACQDQLLITEFNSLLLVGVFDGHGRHGHEVVAYCSSFIIKYFSSASFALNIRENLHLMIEECDASLLNSSKIDCSTSGTTAVLVLFTHDTIWTCSVGDSRAVLAAHPKHFRLPVQPVIQNPSSFKVPVNPKRALKAVVLTLDQKPNISYELERIKKAGGVVAQATDSEGQRVGPYRIWKPNSTLPGLAMSRSLGDSIAKSIGVTSKPIVYHIEACPARDLFVVVASDGVWDVMDNAEVLAFVDKYRADCAKTANFEKRSANETNSLVAELLCEEARFRWFGVCSEEDVPIDDISAVVVEIMALQTDPRIIQRKGITPEQCLDIDEDKQQEFKIRKRFDIRRGSNATIEEENEDYEEDDGE
jgi:serine/threonine protein phosphatase PrpC